MKVFLFLAGVALTVYSITRTVAWMPGWILGASLIVYAVVRIHDA